MYHENILGWFDWHSLYGEMLDFLIKQRGPVNDIHIIEIGALFGKSTCSLIEQIILKDMGERTYLYVVDTCQGSTTESDLKAHAYAAGGNYATILLKNINTCQSFYPKGKRPKVLPIFAEWDTVAQSLLSASISPDMVFLDAGHTEAEVTTDLKRILTISKPSTIIAGHDYTSNWPGVVRAVEETFKGRPTRQFFQHCRNTCWSIGPSC